MKYFLYLYPISQYWDQEVAEYQARPGGQLGDLGKLNTLVEKRYRKRGYRVVWVFFGTRGRPTKPYRFNQSEWVRILPADKVISSGVTYEQMTSAAPKYPDVGRMLGRLAQPIDELVVGGFHATDCVRRVATWAHTQGLPTWVDEDCTDYFFTNPQAIPVQWHPAQGTWWYLEDLSRNLQQVCIQNRAEQPWLARPRLRALQ